MIAAELTRRASVAMKPENPPKKRGGGVSTGASGRRSSHEHAIVGGARMLASRHDVFLIRLRRRAWSRPESDAMIASRVKAREI